MLNYRRKIEIPARLDNLPGARRFVRGFCRGDIRWELAREDLWRLELAVHEAGSNIIRHAYENRMDERILIEIQAFEEHLTVHLNHWGKPFVQQGSVSPPVLDGTSKSGFGLYLIERCVDEVLYECTASGKNTISLLKYRTRVTPSKAPRAAFQTDKEWFK